MWSMFRSLLRLHVFFFFNDTATTEIYTLSLHDALPISPSARCRQGTWKIFGGTSGASESALAGSRSAMTAPARRSEEHTSELQSRQYLVCRLLLEKKNIMRPGSKTTVYAEPIGVPYVPL